MSRDITFGEFAATFERWVPSVGIAPNGCWVWARPVGWGGYATAHADGSSVRVHRHVYVTLVGPIADGYVPDHTCRVRHCVNPNHIEIVTAAENVQRGDRPDGRREEMAARTHCRNGHEYTDETTSLRRGRYRRCLICERETSRRYYERNRDRILTEQRPRQRVGA